MTTSLDKNGPIMQLKVSAIAPCLALVGFIHRFLHLQHGTIASECFMSEIFAFQEEASAAIVAQCTTPHKAAKLIEDMAASIDNPSRFPVALSQENTSYLIDGLKRADLIGTVLPHLNTEPHLTYFPI